MGAYNEVLEWGETTKRVLMTTRASKEFLNRKSFL